MKKIGVIIAVLLAFAIGLALSHISLWPGLDRKTEIDATALLERIEKVAKLVTVEGHISEVYDYKDYYGYDWGIFRKKALIRVKAKVSVGYDLEHIQLTTQPDAKTIHMKWLSDPEILSIDHDLDYYDISEGTFNTFSKDDLNRLNKQAKDYVTEVAKEGTLINEARERGTEMIEMIRFLVEGAGWQLKVEDSHQPKPEIRG